MRRVLASSDAAPARCLAADKGMRVLNARLSQESLQPGCVAVLDKRVYFGTSDGAFEVLSVKPDGKRAMAASSWAAGIHERSAAWAALS